MALTGIKFCKPTVDTKKQSSRPIFQPLRLLSSSASTMHQTKTHDFPFVPLTGHKLVDDPCIPPSFDIDDHTNFEEDFGFVKNNNFTNARAIFKNGSFKGCHQFPMISISQLVGGFVGSKSQVRAKNREPHQIWDIVFQKLDEFVNSRPVGRYSEHCYEFQTLSQNFIGSLYEERSSALGLAASYILADGGNSFTNPISNIAKSSPIQQSAEIILPSVNTFVSHSSVLPSHSPSNQSTVPVILNFVDHLISQSDLTHHNPIIPDPVRFTCVDNSMPTSSTLESSSLHDTLAEQPANKDTLVQKPLPISSEVKQSYAEVAKMAHGRSQIDGDHRQSRIKNSSKRYRKVNRPNHYFVRSFNDSRQRCVDSSNWRDQGDVSSERKDLRRDHFIPSHSGSGESVPKRMSQGQWRKNGLTHMKLSTPLKTVPEIIPSPAREAVNQADTLSCGQSSTTIRENSCQFYNPSKKSCANWRCRQHCQKSSAKRNVRHITVNSLIIAGNDQYEQPPNSDASPSPDKNGDIRINTFENYLTMLPPVRTSQGDRDSSTVVTGGKCKPKSSLPSFTTDGESSCTNLLPNVVRPRCLSETLDRPVETLHFGKERSCSESSESIPVRVGEDSRTNSVSLSSLSSGSSSGSCRLVPISEANSRRRFSSECDSEDSFVIFEGGLECPEYDSDSDSGSDLSSGDSDSEDEVDSFCPRVSLVFCIESTENSTERLRELNERWAAKQRNDARREESAGVSSGVRTSKMVRFAPEPTLATVHRMVRWDYAYRSARCGPWEQMARDRERFLQRVERSEPTLSAVLGAAHRREVLRRREVTGRHDVPPPLLAGPGQAARKRTTLVQGCDAF